ncbi:amino acid permease [Streptomyces sp. NPDC059786]|uniref:amino acid permease n=1 Tax=Streptomyces sp. NPDC059786 TaxID=3346946 RepID=UPI00364F5851
MGVFGNSASSISVICVLAGGMTMFGYGLIAGGPAVMVWGWAVIGLTTLILGLCLAEVTSAYPTSGALYFMAHKLGGPRWAWVTGWLNLLGLLGAIAGIDYGAALFVGAFASLQWGTVPTPENTMMIFGGILVLHGLLNSFKVKVVTVLNSISVWWQLGGVTVIVGALVFAPGERQSASFVFGHYANGTGISSPIYVAAIGCLLAGYTFCGYDASSHLSEETTQAQVSAPRGIVSAILFSWIVGFVLIVGLLFAMESYDGTLATATGVPPAQILIDVLGTGMAKALLLVVIVAQLFCGNAETLAASRMIFAFSRDGALPFSRTWRRVSRSRTPVAAVWLAVTVALFLALPSLYSPTAYAAVTAINVVGITPAYVIPVYLAWRARDKFQRGPWSLGRFSRPLALISMIYVPVLAVVICLPQTYPITITSFNYAPVTLIAVLLIAWITWMTKGRRDYSIPKTGATAEDSQLAGGMV